MRASDKFKLSGTVHGRSSDTNLVEIHEEMSELLDKQVNVQKESLKKLLGFTQAYEKINFDELWDIDSSNNEDTNSLVNKRIGRERMVHRA